MMAKKWTLEELMSMSIPQRAVVTQFESLD
ncbi:hypothetical protein FHS65_001884 [Brevundimonas halotolerans]|uniref:Uncharacterized protein n=1 Tax=Brevundimonas halotolerans TaxID=69670 RepID=A0A7W9A4N0_9CAUL|nr:hypothetical protein [Brevundimonas halotolerans]